MYIKKVDLDKFIHVQIPRKIWNMYINKELSSIAFKIYVELFDRLKLSAYNNWIDNDENVYIKYSYIELMKILNLKSKSSIADGLAELKNLNLILQEKGFNTSSKFYLSNILEASKNDRSTEKRTPVVHSCEQQKYTNMYPNHNNINHNNDNNNNNNNDNDENNNTVVAVDEIFIFLKENNLNTQAITQAIKNFNYSLDYLKEQLYIAQKLKEIGKINNIGGCFSNALTRNISLTLPQDIAKPVKKDLGNKEKNIIEQNTQAKARHDEALELKEEYDKYFNLLSEAEQEYILDKAFNLANEKYGNSGLKSLVDIMARTESKYLVLEEYLSERKI